MQTDSSYAGVAYAVSSAILMATIGVFSKYAGLDADAITFFRLIFGSCFMLLFLSVRKNIKLLRDKPSISIVINGFFLAGFILFYVEAMNHTTMANAIMLVYLAPLFAAIYGHFFMAEKVNILTIILILLALCGFAMMLEFKLDFSGDKQRLIGLGLALLAMLCYSGFILMNRKIKAHVYNSSFYQMLIGGLIVSPFLLSNIPEISPQQWFLLIAVGFFPGFLAICFAVIALRKLEAATFGTLAYFEPLAVVLFGWFLFSEKLSTLQICGCAVILLCGIIKTVKE